MLVGVSEPVSFASTLKGFNNQIKVTHSNNICTEV